MSILSFKQELLRKGIHACNSIIAFSLFFLDQNDVLLIVGIVVTVLYKKKKFCFEPKRPKRESYGVGIIRTESTKKESIFN